MKQPNLFVLFVYSILVLTLNNAIASDRTALVIGNGAYRSAPLKNPVSDASDIANVLVDQGFKVDLKINATQREMKTAVKNFGRNLRKNGGIGLFYYAGHGLQINGSNYLIPVDAEISSESDVQYESLDAGRVLGKMEDAGNDLNIIILDACRNNPFARSFRSMNSGLARMDAPKGSIIAYATSPGDLAADGSGRNGIYTKYLIRNIQNPQLTVEQVFKNVRVAVVEETSNKQVPWESSSLMGTFYFDPNKTRQKISTPDRLIKIKPIDTSYEMLFWESVKNSKNTKMFEAYLNQFPNGAFAQLAKINIEQYKIKPSPAKKEKYVQQNPIKVASIDRNTKASNIVAEVGHYAKYKNGIIYDKKTNLEWLAGPDSPINVYRAKKWIKRIDIDGGGWRLPTFNEISRLYADSTNRAEIYSWMYKKKFSILYSLSESKGGGTVGYDFMFGQRFNPFQIRGTAGREFSWQGPTEEAEIKVTRVLAVRRPGNVIQ